MSNIAEWFRSHPSLASNENDGCSTRQTPDHHTITYAQVLMVRAGSTAEQEAWKATFDVEVWRCDIALCDFMNGYFVLQRNINRLSMAEIRL
jgi:hypothetical protein